MKTTRNKFIIVGFIMILLTLATLGIVKSRETMDIVTEQISDERLDSIVQKKIDYRFTSYDNKFMYDNLVIIDSNDVVIGRLILYTNKKEIDSFYDSNDKWIKTRLYDNLKNGTLRILQKPE